MEMFDKISTIHSIVTLFLVLFIAITIEDESIPVVNETSMQSALYEATSNFSFELKKFSEAISNEYWKILYEHNDTNGGDDGILVPWLAYSSILDHINNAIIDMTSESMMSSDLINNELISASCEQSMTDFLMALVQQKSWAYRILDASGFISSGILAGSYTNFGDFDECLHAGDNSNDNDINGQYCLLKYHTVVPTNRTHLITQDLLYNTTGTALESTFFTDLLRYAHYFKVRQGRTALCFPSGCSREDIQTIINNLIQIDKFIVNVDSCQMLSDIEHFSPLQQIILSIFVIIIAVVLTITFIDILWKENESNHLNHTLGLISIKHNLKSLLASPNGENFASINGLRVLTMFWLVYGHAYLLSVKDAFRSSTRFIESLFDMKMYLLFNAWPAVDIFFIMSALLHSYHSFKLLQTKQQINPIRTILNRIARLWPSLWVIVALVFIIPNLGQGPLWSEIMEQQVNGCYQSWWMIVTFTANLRSPNNSNLCQVHTWYLSAEFQLFLISFAFIFLIYHFGKKAIIGMSVCNLLFCTFITVYFYVKRFHPTILFNQIDEMQMYREMFEIYMPTYLHLTPYLVGIVTGYMLVLHKNQQPNPQMPRFFKYFWIPALSFILLILISGYVFTTYPQTPMLIQSIYAGFHRLAWSLSIAYIIFYCEVTDSGNIIKDFLSSQIFTPISKLCYSIYLIHFILTWVRYAYARQPLVFNHITMFNEFIINSVYSVILAITIYLLVECPFSNIYSKYIGKRNWTFGTIRSKKNNLLIINRNSRLDVINNNNNNTENTCHDEKRMTIIELK